MNEAKTLANEDRLQVSVREACRLMSYGMTKMYELINAGEIPVIRDPVRKRSVRIAVEDLRRFQQRHSTRPAIEPQKS